MIFAPFLDTLIDTLNKTGKGAKIKTLYEALNNYLQIHPTDEEIIELFQQVRALQTNGYQLKDAILKATANNSSQKIKISTSNLHKDNIPAYLAIRHRAKLIKLRSAGHGYGKIAKLLAQKNVYNKKTKKPYSRSTIKRALELIEKGKL